VYITRDVIGSEEKNRKNGMGYRDPLGDHPRPPWGPSGRSHLKQMGFEVAMGDNYFVLFRICTIKCILCHQMVLPIHAHAKCSEAIY